MGLFHGAMQLGTGSAPMLPGLTRGYRAGSNVRASQGASELGRGVQATAGETGTCGWAGAGRGHLGALSRLETDATQGSDSWEPHLSWGGGSLRSQALVVESVLGEPWGRAMCQCRGAMRQQLPPRQEPGAEHELTVGVWTAPLRERGQRSSGTRGLAGQLPCPTVPDLGQRWQPRSAKSKDHQTHPWR